MTQKCECGESSKPAAEVKLYCDSCDKPGKIFSIKDPTKVALITAVIFAGAVKFTDYAITDNRYPVDVEYTLMAKCVGASQGIVTKGEFSRIEERCLCAIEDTMNEISYTRFIVQESAFVDAMWRNKKSCR